MGLCKCPKKKVTNLFCFEHRVNVCEHCLVESHPKCVVQSYLSWLTDSDYDTDCSLCATPLANKQTVRLQCLHLMHWECLDAWARGLPSNTAPAGYRCHMCREAIFPAANHTSPTVDALRACLQTTNWARAGLGLSLLPEMEGGSAVSFKKAETSTIPQPPPLSTSVDQSNTPRCSTPATVLNVDDVYPHPHAQQSHFTARKPMGFGEDEGNMTDTRPLLSRGRDEDLPENKYKRRSAGEWLNRWLRSRYGSGSGLGSNRKRMCFYVLVAVLVLFTAFTVLSRLVSGPSQDDPQFDPLANPNIRVAAVHDSNLN